jgi:hypothetical protein
MLLVLVTPIYVIGLFYCRVSGYFKGRRHEVGLWRPLLDEKQGRLDDLELNYGESITALKRCLDLIEAAEEHLGHKSYPGDLARKAIKANEDFYS